MPTKEPSFNKVNYSLRPNKSVQRKLILECLMRMKQQFPISDYKYVGFGSFWFVDFLLAHKVLMIQDMVSIEGYHEYEQRANFNKPFACIRIEPGESTLVLPHLNLDKKRSVIWLDYDSGPEGPVCSDIRLVCESAMEGSVVLVTINSSIEKVKRQKDVSGNDLNEEAALRFFFGDLVPSALPKDAFEKEVYPRMLGEILIDHFERATRKAGRRERFYPLFNFHYSDGTSMITVGGIILGDNEKQKLDKCKLEDIDYVTGREQFSISVPPLTHKEKIHLDQILPSDSMPSDEQIASLGFKLTSEQIYSYAKFYRHYPVYGEVQF